MSSNIIPSVNDDLSAPDKRIELFRIDAEPIVKYVTPGLGRFISRFTDDMLVSFFKNDEIDKYQKRVPSHLRYLHLIKEVWRKMVPESQKAEWEKVAAQEQHFSQLIGNAPGLFDRTLKREIDRKLYEHSEAFEEFKKRETIFKQYFSATYNIDLDVITDSPFERTTNLSIDVDYTESITSPHSLQLLKVFLSLEQFVNVLIDSDKEKAIELLKQTLNYIPQQTAYLRPMLQKLLPKSSIEDLERIASMIHSTDSVKKPYDGGPSPTISQTIDYRQLAFYPLLILEKLLCRFSPEHVGMQKAADFRHQALKLGVMDFVLECLSHFTHRSSNASKIRSWRMPLPQYSVRFSVEFPSKKPTNDTQTDDTQSNQNQQNKTKSNPTYFAKGTGYGSGDTKQVWDYKEHEQKLRYDDDNIACLLNILRAFIQPPQENALTSSANENTSTIKKVDSKEIKSKRKRIQTAKAVVSTRNCIQMEEEFLKLLYRSSLKSVIKSYLMSDTLLEINKNIATYHAVFQFIVALSNSPRLQIDVHNFFALHDDDEKMPIDEEYEDDNLNESTHTDDVEQILPFDIIFCSQSELNGSVKLERKLIIELLDRFSTNLEDYLKRVAPELLNKSNQLSSDYFSLAAFFGFRNEDKKANEAEDDHLHELCGVCKEVVHILKEQDDSEVDSSITKAISRRVSRMRESSDAGTSSSRTGSNVSSVSPDTLTDSEKYCSELKAHQFASISFAKIFGANNYYFQTQLKTVTTTSSAANPRFKRIACEIHSLRSGLILSSSSSAFVKSCEENIDAMKCLITGPVDTPYSNGCFEFDFFFPSNFPQVPPQVNLRTTGNGGVRFNPNLYNCGKVCLSILGTWPGRPEEGWNVSTSSVLQVITSIQSLIFVNDPYYNEPGFEKSINTTQGNLASKRYNSNIQIQTVRWAMLEQLKRPPIGFEDVVRLHFLLKKDEICSQINRWIAEWQDQSQDKRCTSTADELEKLLKQLLTEFQKLK